MKDSSFLVQASQPVHSNMKEIVAPARNIRELVLVVNFLFNISNSTLANQDIIAAQHCP